MRKTALGHWARGIEALVSTRTLVEESGRHADTSLVEQARVCGALVCWANATPAKQARNTEPSAVENRGERKFI